MSSYHGRYDARSMIDRGLVERVSDGFLRRAEGPVNNDLSLSENGRRNGGHTSRGSFVFYIPPPKGGSELGTLWKAWSCVR